MDDRNICPATGLDCLTCDRGKCRLAALPRPAGPLVERVARAGNEAVQSLLSEYDADTQRPFMQSECDYVFSQAAISVVLAEIEAERAGSPIIISFGGELLDYRRGHNNGREHALNRLTARLTGGQGDE